MTNALRAIAALIVLASAAYLVAVKRGLVPPSRAGFATLVALAAAALSAVAVAAAVRAARRARRLTSLAEALVAAGLVLVSAGGSARWAFALRGAAVLVEREPVRLSALGDVNGVDAGPLADRGALDVVLGLGRLSLVAAGPARFRAVSQVKVLAADGEEVGLRIAAGEPASYRTLVFSQGAFGFVPHIVIQKDGRVLFDESVPFRTVREGKPGLAFVADLDVAAEALAIHGAVTLEDLSDDMKGHPTLELVLERAGEPLRSGRLKPGEFAELPEGFRVGFTGLRRWSQIDFSRRTFAHRAMYAGFGLFLVGVLLLPLAVWRKW